MTGPANPLVPTPEHDWAGESIDTAAQVATEHIDLDAIYELIQDLPSLEATKVGGQKTEIRSQKSEDCEQITSVKPKLELSKIPRFSFTIPKILMPSKKQEPKRL
jgi:cobyrinic acid a,c-diamide synthase